MNRNSQLAPPSEASMSDADLKALERLREEFPEWWLGWSPKRISWDAKRRRGAFWTGGIWALEATSAEMLRDLLLEVQILDAKHAGARS